MRPSEPWVVKTVPIGSFSPVKLRIRIKFSPVGADETRPMSFLALAGSGGLGSGFGLSVGWQLGKAIAQNVVKTAMIENFTESPCQRLLQKALLKL